VCVEVVGIDAGVPIDGGGEPDAEVAPLLGGNVFFYSFDDEGSPSVIHDRSGNRLDAQSNRAVLVDGQYGKAREFSDTLTNDELRIADTSELFAGNILTVEAWVNHAVAQQSGVVFGDEDPAGGADSIEYSVALDATDHVEFRTNTGCGTTPIALVSEGTVGAEQWHHVAVTWDATRVRFYIDGMLSGERPQSALPCESDGPRGYLVGRKSDDSDPWNGMIDELKLSNVAKSATDIQASMNHDSAAVAVGVCGDHLLEAEACMSDQECCSATCEVAAAGTSCAQGALCNAAGACLVETGRTTSGLLALYEFNESSGVVVADTSGVDPALDLTIDTEAAVVWGGGNLQVNDAVIINSGVSALKIETAVEASNEVSVEAWVVAANATQAGPARIVTMSPDTASRNITLGQEGGLFLTRMRSSLATTGFPVVDSPVGEVVPNQLTHLLMTRSSDGERRMYVDGVLRSRNTIEGTLGNWSGYPLGIANEATGSRLWLGRFHLVAVYGRALSAAEVSANFAAGPD